MNNPTLISCIIIGYNSKQELISLLKSINNTDKIENKKQVEIIYIDDGSNDDSKKTFDTYSLQYTKKSFLLSPNQGRPTARQTGVNCASGEWLLFLNSSVVVEKNIFYEYLQIIQKNPSTIALAGKIKYTSKESMFEKYLNNKQRGINQYSNEEKIKFQHLLFGNAAINKKVFKGVPFNFQLNHYGGEELDFAYRLYKKYPNQTLAAKRAIVTRSNHPAFKQHCKRMLEFGNTNFLLLNRSLQKKIIKYPLFLNIFFVFKVFVNCLYFFSIKTYNIFPGEKINFTIIRLGLWSAILKGFYLSSDNSYLPESKSS